MKRIIYIAVILMGILPFFGKELQSSCFAQSMAIEDAWNNADETGYYGIYKCDSCGMIFEGNDQILLEMEYNMHLWEEHLNKYDDNNNSDNNNDDSSGNGESNNNGNSGDNYTNVINIEDAATIAQQIGLDYKNNFLYNYLRYGNGSVYDKIVSLSNFINFIINKYGAIDINNPSSINNYSKYFIITLNYTSGNYRFYRIITNYSNVSNPYYGIYAFRR